MQAISLVDTRLKIRPVDASQLSIDQILPVAQGERLEIKAVALAARGHLKLTLPHPGKGSALWFGFRSHFRVEGITASSHLGVDSSTPFTETLRDTARKEQHGNLPQYWGRYFSGLDCRTSGDPAQYLSKNESSRLRVSNIRLLPIGRNTTAVGGSWELGREEGQRQAIDFIDAMGQANLLGQGAEFLFFLDVEPSHPLSKDFYTGWAAGVACASDSLKMLPGVYLNRSDTHTLNNLKLSIEAGSACHGLWVAAYLDAASIPLRMVDHRAKPVIPCPVKVLLWQYVGDHRGLDFNISHQDVSDLEFLNRLAIP